MAPGLFLKKGQFPGWVGNFGVGQQDQSVGRGLHLESLDNSMSVKIGWFDLMSLKFLITGTRFVPRDHKSCIYFRLISLPYSILSAFNQKSFLGYNCASISVEMVACKFRHLHTLSMALIIKIVDLI